MLGAVETIPEGIVKGPLTVFPRNSVFTQYTPVRRGDYKALASFQPWDYAAYRRF
jgi:hypothetical protein